MKRRVFITLLGGAITAPFVGAQEARKVRRVGVLVAGTRLGTEHLIAALEQGLRDLGYTPGKDILIEARWAEGNSQRLPDLAQEIVRSKPDVIQTGVNASTTAARAATQSIPIVFAVGTDVIGAKYVQTLAKPGGNTTGITWDVGGGTVVKRLELMKEIAPRISRIAVLWEKPYREQYKPPMDAAAPAIGVSTSWHEFSGDPERDFAEMIRQRAEALYVHAGGGLFTRRAEIIALATKHRMPSTFPVSEFVVSGALLSYGPNLAGAYRASARHIDRVLKGAKAGDVPVEQPTAIDLTINLKTAKILGLKIPQGILARAARVIE